MSSWRAGWAPWTGFRCANSRGAIRRCPFVVAADGPREVTLQRPALNLYRIAADYGQGVAGLATYAYRRLGWRTVTVLPDAAYSGWNAESAFVREFCALGGRSSDAGCRSRPRRRPSW